MNQWITVRVNGVAERHHVSTNLSLLTFLRNTLALTGAKEGCNEGECGACVVLLDGKAVNSCLVLAVEADRREVTTIEGMSHRGKLHPLQQAFCDQHAVQCGFCTPGSIMTAVSLLSENAAPSQSEIRSALAGNLCRCTGYHQIIQAVSAAATQLRTPDPNKGKPS